MTMVKKCSHYVKRSPFLTINLGHILIISTWIAGVLVTYGTMNERMETIRQQQINLENRIRRLENNSANLIGATKDIEWLKRELNRPKQ